MGAFKNLILSLILALTLLTSGCHAVDNFRSPHPQLYGGTIEATSNICFFALRPFAIIKHPFYLLFVIVDLPLSAAIETLAFPPLLTRTLRDF